MYDAVITTFRTRAFPPSPDLAGIVRRYVVVARAGGAAELTPMIAWSKLRLVVHLAVPATVEMPAHRRLLERPMVGGVVTRPFVMHTPGARMEAFFVELTEPGFFGLFGDVARELRDQTCDLWTLLPDAARRSLRDELRERSTDRERREAVEAFLRARMRNGSWQRESRHVSQALRVVHGSLALPQVRGLVRELGVSEAHLRRRFQAVMGTSPKSFLALERARRAFLALRARPHATGATIATELGFFDQAHMIRELHKHTGHTPRELRDARFAFAEAASR
ncbi:MAG: helix-turn-helix transcriptional regulator [Sandaracinaceae bacterium]